VGVEPHRGAFPWDRGQPLDLEAGSDKDHRHVLGKMCCVKAGGSRIVCVETLLLNQFAGPILLFIMLSVNFAGSVLQVLF